MRRQTGFTLIEIIVALVVLSVTMFFGIPTYINYINMGAAKAAQNNLIAIYNSEKSFYFKNAQYCIRTGPPPHCTDLTTLNQNLGLGITDGNFDYVCNNDATGFICTATNLNNNN